MQLTFATLRAEGDPLVEGSRLHALNGRIVHAQSRRGRNVVDGINETEGAARKIGRHLALAHSPN